MKVSGRILVEMVGERRSGRMAQSMKVRLYFKYYPQLNMANLYFFLPLLIMLIGQWKNNKANGKGKFWHVDGDIFEGKHKIDYKE